ncbi:glycoside hydrolase superfamily [Paraphoma chrysanthemicola]|uniref:Beta-glucuronidase n=1 Tax=Paraphoma chrysanthemicola TaxID=798071 RepID=A0A8K0QV59_9PLEO|nr:glycoside hydrolase superfamily [Paraphoma chrysanthemicola]
MLRPQSTATREVVSLDGLWNFEVVHTIPPTESDSTWTRRLSNKTQVPVPASYNDIFLDYDIRNHVGWVKYQRQVRVPRGWQGTRYFVRCDAATHHGRIYANDKLLADHHGGYTPFDADITDIVGSGQEFQLTIAVSSELTNETIPPGKVTSIPDGRKKQTYMHDFFNYSGLSRSVWLYSVPEEYISDISINTDVDWDKQDGIIHYRVDLAPPSSSREMNCRVSIRDEQGIEVAIGEGFENTITIPSAHLWQPGAAYLYDVAIQLSRSSDESPLDAYQVNIGVRTVEVRGSQFLINNKPFYFTGFGKHEDSAIRGKGHDPAYLVHDFQLLDWIGANSFRTSHYPYAEEVLDYADRQGIVVIDETAAVGLNLGVSSVMWSISNEPASHEEGAREYFEPLVKVTRKLDKRPVCFANFGLATSEKDRISDMFDVLCLNRYYGWYEACGDMKLAEQELEKDLVGWQTKYRKPMIMTEYGADSIAGLHSAMLTPWSEEFQADILEIYHRVFDRVECIVGEHVWNFADFQTSQHVFRVDGNKKGVFTRDRKPKVSAQVLRRRWRLEGVGRLETVKDGH